MISRFKKRHVKGAALFIAWMVCLPGPATAQQQSPARDLGLQSALSSQVSQRPATSVLTPADTPPASPDMRPWWDGMEAAAEESLNLSSWLFSFSLGTAWEYDSNFLMRSVNEVETHVFSVSPAVAVQYGTPGHGIDFNFKYAPEFRVFSESQLDDILNHALNSTLGFSGSRSRVLVNTSYVRNEGGNVEVGTAVTSDTYRVDVQGSYDISAKTTIGGSAGLNRSEFQAFNSYTQFLGSIFADYAFTAKTRLGFQLGYEALDQENAVNQEAISAALRIGWAPVQKLTFAGQIGVEHRSFDGSESITAPVANLTVTYAPKEKTTLNLNLYRRATPSIGLSNAMFYATGATLSARQAFSEKMAASLTLGYEIASYEAGVAALALNREDKFFFVRPQLSYNFKPNLMLSLFFQWTNNASNNLAAEFYRTQVGASLAYTF